MDTVLCCCLPIIAGLLLSMAGGLPSRGHYTRGIYAVSSLALRHRPDPELSLFIVPEPGLEFLLRNLTRHFEPQQFHAQRQYLRP